MDVHPDDVPPILNDLSKAAAPLIQDILTGRRLVSHEEIRALCPTPEAAQEFLASLQESGELDDQLEWLREQHAAGHEWAGAEALLGLKDAISGIPDWLVDVIEDLARERLRRNAKRRRAFNRRVKAALKALYMAAKTGISEDAAARTVSLETGVPESTIKREMRRQRLPETSPESVSSSQ